MQVITLDIELIVTELFIRRLLKVPGPFLIEGDEPCPFCEDENKVPVVINNNLSAEIKKIPLKLICEEAVLTGNQLQDVFRAKEGDDYIIKKCYTDFICKDLLLKNEIPNRNPIIEHTKFPLTVMNPIIYNTITDEDLLNSVNCTKSSIDPHSIANLMQCNQPTTSQIFDQDHDYLNMNMEKSRYVGHVIQSIVEDYKQKFQITDQKEQTKKSDCTSVGNKAIHICRQKDPYLREINLAIFGSSNITYPEENTEAYFKLAEKYALLGATPLSGEPNTSKNDYSPSKSELSPSTGTVPKTTMDNKKEDNKRATFEDPTILSDEATQYPSTSQQLLGTSYPFASDPSNFFASFAAQGNLLNHSAGCSNNMNPYQIPASFFAYNNLNQKTKARTSPKLTPQMPLFLTPHQYLTQASQVTNYPTTAFPQTLIQPTSNFTSHLQPNPIYNASFKDTHINMAIIQQQQYQQYNMLAAAAAGNYEMFVYEQMLHQTQKIKSVVARNRLDKQRLQSDLGKSLPKTSSASPLPPISNAISSTALRSNDLANSVTMRTLLSELNPSSSTSPENIKPEIVASNTETRSSSQVSLDQDSSKFESNTMQDVDSDLSG